MKPVQFCIRFTFLYIFPVCASTNKEQIFAFQDINISNVSSFSKVLVGITM